jgi:hypothetical protein
MVRTVGIVREMPTSAKRHPTDNLFPAPAIGEGNHNLKDLLHTFCEKPVENSWKALHNMLMLLSIICHALSYSRSKNRVVSSTIGKAEYLDIRLGRGKGPPVTPFNCNVFISTVS